MKVRKHLTALAVVGSALVAMPAAQAHVSLALVAGGTYTGVIANGLEVTFDCTATGAGDIVSVAITTCKLSTGLKNATIALPGNTATIAAADNVPFAPFTLCYSAVFTFSDSHTKTVSGCNSLAPSVGGLPPLTGGGVTVE